MVVMPISSAKISTSTPLDDAIEFGTEMPRAFAQHIGHHLYNTI